jgi:hypothetical protein
MHLIIFLMDAVNARPVAPMRERATTPAIIVFQTDRSARHGHGHGEARHGEARAARWPAVPCPNLGPGTALSGHSRAVPCRATRHGSTPVPVSAQALSHNYITRTPASQIYITSSHNQSKFANQITRINCTRSFSCLTE